MRKLSFAQALNEALSIAMQADERVFIMGEDIGVYGGAFGVTGDLVHKFGEDRVMDTPIAELGTAGAAVGAAVAGGVISKWHVKTVTALKRVKCFLKRKLISRQSRSMRRQMGSSITLQRQQVRPHPSAQLLR